MRAQEHPAQPRRARPDELTQVIALIATEQQRRGRNIPYLGNEVDGIRSELAVLRPSWAETVRVVSDGGAVTGAALVEVDAEAEAEADSGAEAGQAWIYGPWVAGPESSWARHAAGLLAAAIDQVPDTIGRMELAGDVENVRLASLAAGLGWARGVVNHALILDEVTTGTWPRSEDADLRPAQAGDAERLAALHGEEFAGAYLSAAQLERSARHDASRMLVATSPEGALIGYASGQVHADGEGFIDFVAVDRQWRAQGVGRRLVMALTRDLLARSAQRRVCLTVQEPRIAARSLYAELGFRPDVAIVAYRTTRPA